MKFSLLASGSKGNCCLIQHKDTQIIIDCGSTKRYLKSCFEELQYDYTTTDALLITHTHMDHVAQIKMFDDVATYSSVQIETKYLTIFQPFETFHIKDIKITVLPMSHDCDGTVGFVLESDDEKLVYMTDTGYVKGDVKEHIQNADYYIFESNHDIEMLMQTNRPVYLKQRIINDNGHLCNHDCAQILSEVMNDKTKEIVLAHISQEGNTRDLALQTLKNTLIRKKLYTEELTLFPAGQYEVYCGGNKE